MRSALVVVVGLAGCAAGGGPYVGYALNRGVVWGAEAGGGMAIGQLAIGIQNRDRFAYFRVDITGNNALWRREGEDLGVGGRWGIGYGGGATHRGGVLAVGANLGYRFERSECPDDNGTIGLLGFEFRYAAGEAQLVATSRIEGQQRICWF